MAFSKVMAFQTNMKFIIPCAGKLFYSSIERKRQALGLVLNKGYFESSSLQDLLVLMDELNINIFIRVGNIDKIIKKDKSITYRQRIYFKSLLQLLIFLKQNGVILDMTDNFRITVNNLLNVMEELPKLEYIANTFGVDIETFLTDACKIHLHCLLTSLNMYSVFRNQIPRLIRKTGYLDLAPLLVSSYSIEHHTSSLFIEPKSSICPGMFSYNEIYDKDDLKIGYTLDNVEKYFAKVNTDENKDERRARTNKC